MRRRQIQIAALLACTVLALGGLFLLAGPASAQFTGGAPQAGKPTDDGFDALPLALKARSYSSLVNAGLVHPSAQGSGSMGAAPAPMSVPALNITWGAAVNISGSPGGTYGANEPAAAMHPLNPLLALAGGNTYCAQPHPCEY